MIQYPVSHNLRPFNSLSRDHGITEKCPWCDYRSCLLLSTPSLGITKTRQTQFRTIREAFNSLSRDHQQQRVPASTRLCRYSASTFNSLSRDHYSEVEARFNMLVKLSTPSLGITVQKLRFLSDYHPDDFQLPLSGSHEQGRPREARGHHSPCFQLPLSGSPMGHFADTGVSADPVTFNSLSRDHIDNHHDLEYDIYFPNFQLPLSGSQGA